MATRKQKAAARKGKSHRKGHRAHAKRRKGRRGHRGGHISLKILERRLKKLSHIVHKRKGR